VGRHKGIVEIGGVAIGRGRPLALIAGPCALESETVALETASRVAEIAGRLGLPYVFKSSYLKDNRSSPGAYSGPGLDKGLEILARVRSEVGVPVLTDVHSVSEVAPAAEVVDALQIPAFLCRQTSLIEAAAGAGRPLNIKKGQFMSPEDMPRAAEKAVRAGCRDVLLTERGVTFGYRDLVVDMRSIAIMRRGGWPVVFDVTHSLQLPGAADGASGGRPDLAPVLARAACGAGCDALFIETHPEPASARSDALSMVALEDLEGLLTGAAAVAATVRSIDEEGTVA